MPAALRHRWLVALALAAHCDAPRGAPVANLPSPNAPPASAPIELPRDTQAPNARSGYFDLDVPGFGAAVVYVPSGAGPRVVVVAAHGNYDRPAWQCHAWHDLTGERAFVLCPRGVARLDSPSARDVRFTYAAQGAFNREVDASLAALRARYGARVAGGPIVYAGFSLGAIFGVGYLRATRERVAAAALVEGGHTVWSGAAVRAFADKGGRAVLFGCDQAWCARDARAVAPRFRAAHIETALGYAPGQGHAYGGRVADAMRPAFERLIAPALGGDSAPP